MSSHLIICDFTTKESMDCGKPTVGHGNFPPAFQMPTERVMKFLRERWDHDVRFLKDTGNLPEYEDDTWKEIDSWTIT